LSHSLHGFCTFEPHTVCAVNPIQAKEGERDVRSRKRVDERERQGRSETLVYGRERNNFTLLGGYRAWAAPPSNRTSMKRILIYW
jgi:hypothetical protein